MGASGQLHRRVAIDPSTRATGSTVDRWCVRPGCGAAAQATLSFRYAQQEASIEALAPEPVPQSYDLCADHATRTRPPRGWQLRDRRPSDGSRPARPSLPPSDLGGDRTVAVLAAALRAAPDAASERAVGSLTAVIGPAPGAQVGRTSTSVSS